jgi:hypothetical protein
MLRPFKKIRSDIPTAVLEGHNMNADSNSHVAWHRAQLKKNRDSLKAMEIARFRFGRMTGSSTREHDETVATLKRKIAESERCIALVERQTRRPLTTDFGTLTQVRWSDWNNRTGAARQ